MPQANHWNIQQMKTICKQGGWLLVEQESQRAGANLEPFMGVLNLHCIIFVSHRLATNKSWDYPAKPARIAYFPPWDNTYFITS
jgi:hypothetical protein